MSPRLNRIIDLGCRFRDAQEAFYADRSKENLKLSLVACENFDREPQRNSGLPDEAFRLHSAGILVRNLQKTYKLTRSLADKVEMERAKQRFDALLKDEAKKLQHKSMFAFIKED